MSQNPLVVPVAIQQNTAPCIVISFVPIVHPCGDPMKIIAVSVPMVSLCTHRSVLCVCPVESVTHQKETLQRKQGFMLQIFWWLCSTKTASEQKGKSLEAKTDSFVKPRTVPWACLTNSCCTAIRPMVKCLPSSVKKPAFFLTGTGNLNQFLDDFSTAAE